MVEKKIPISAVVVSYNEGNYLDKCLSSLTFCDEIIVIDLNSSDNTKDIAKRYASKIIDHEHVEVVEIVRKYISDKTKHDWILFLDPDENITPKLANDITELFNGWKLVPESVGEVKLPWQFYFREKKLKGTFWGGIKYKACLVNRLKVKFSSNVHRDIKLKEQFKSHAIVHRNGNYIHHAWMSSFGELKEKHKRYLKHEGASLFRNGYNYSLKLQLAETIGFFFKSLFKWKGYKDGFIGFYLSYFYSWYTFMKWRSLRKYESSKHGE